MTKKVFWQNPYLTELDTVVKTVAGNKVSLAETIFFAFSGGQESDHGTIGGYAVIEAKKVEKEIFYFLPNDHKLQIGDAVKVTIDWPRRYKLMRLHFAAEIILELVLQQYPDLEKIGAHIGQDKARIDFLTEQNVSEFLPAIQQQSQAIVNADHEIETGYSDLNTERRYWKIAGFSQVPCGGTHVKSTKEIGEIRLKRVNPGKGKERIEIYVS